MHVVEVCLAHLWKAGVSAPLLSFLVAIKASKSLSVDAVIILIVQRNTLISTTKGNLLAFAGFAELRFLIPPLGYAIQHREGPNPNRIIKGIYISPKKNRALSSNVLLLLKSERSSSHILQHVVLSWYGILLGSCDTQFVGALASWAMLSLVLTTLLKQARYLCYRLSVWSYMRL